MLLGHPVKASIIQRKYLNIWVTYIYTVSKEFVILVALTYSLKQKPHFNKWIHGLGRASGFSKYACFVAEKNCNAG